MDNPCDAKVRNLKTLSEILVEMSPAYKIGGSTDGKVVFTKHNDCRQEKKYILYYLQAPDLTKSKGMGMLQLKEEAGTSRS